MCSVLCATRDNFLEKLLQLRSSFFQVEDDYGILSEQLVNSATTTAHLNFSREILSSWFNYLLKQKKAVISKINTGENLIYKNKKNENYIFSGKIQIFEKLANLDIQEFHENFSCILWFSLVWKYL